MTVYELIQELSQYQADTEIKFHVKAKFETDVEAEFDRKNEDDTQEVTATVEFDEYVNLEDIDDRENFRYASPYIQINLTY